MLLLDWISQSVYVCVSSQEPLVNKGDMHTFSTNNEEEKTQYSEERKRHSTVGANDRTKYTETNID